jgi:hypothetical protein
VSVVVVKLLTVNSGNDLGKSGKTKKENETSSRKWGKIMVQDRRRYLLTITYHTFTLQDTQMKTGTPTCITQSRHHAKT